MKNPGKVRARTYGTKSPSRSEYKGWFYPFELPLKLKILFVHMFPLFSPSTGPIALLSMPMERSVHGGVHCENCRAKACHLAKVWGFEWGQVRQELFWRKAGRSWSLEKLRSPFFFELIAKFIDAISLTQLKSLRVAMNIEQHVLFWPASPSSRPIDWDGEASTKFKRLSRSHFLSDSRKKSHPRLANYNTFATVYSVLKSDKNWLQTKPAKTT